jgi:hypothetical protein
MERSVRGQSCEDKGQQLPAKDRWSGDNSHIVKGQWHWLNSHQLGAEGMGETAPGKDRYHARGIGETVVRMQTVTIPAHGLEVQKLQIQLALDGQ